MSAERRSSYGSLWFLLAGIVVFIGALATLLGRRCRRVASRSWM
ncbi:LPXTG cell wall anchor domain-containing protein [Candidatus Palauibacter sp.]